MGETERRINAVWFSPTGTTQVVAEVLAQSICRNLGSDAVFKSRSFTLPGEREKPLEFGKDDIVVLGVPVYAGRVPNILLKYLDTMNGGGALGVPVVLYGNRDYDDALIELKDIMEGKNFNVIGAGAFIGEHSFSRILAEGRPDGKDIESVEGFGAKISEKLKVGNINGAVEVKGNKPYRPYYRPRDIEGNFYDFRKIKPKTNDNCTDCKICVDVCPMGSIDSDDVSKFTGICIKCGACVKKCPVEAKYYDDVNYLKHQHELEDENKDRKEPELFI
ncbi:4Fe-4S dicluster domain-containing protein [Dethiosulfatibacter aminovorans DSM 17477]|uniref:4Fe-4S dicluster domain-containing protein n=1 Tax=Dethiosulfatibacter aminovorans DSM 17477 TaxID=1121476 RepID=A0A1M6F5Y7_9FIRM|nr:EFR1 family ferrodoxin [Dethiosulfatibacter aminovorans]SHI93115.1 4Fe-4S dicluster domain-containing protein [Dethiosulfatibacter aminovorans DSM 17477]